jgi:predicted AAA+ superfamily ATPase
MSIDSKRYVDRDITQLLVNALEKDKIIVLTGPRQAGKTTLIKKQLSQENLIGYINFDDIRDRQIVQNPKLGLKEAIKRRCLDIKSPNLVIVLDECQKCPLLFDEVKLIHDANNKHPKFVLTGSSSLELYSKSAESLAGRVRNLHLSPFSFSEYLDTKPILQNKKFAYMPYLKNQSLTEEIGKEIFYNILPSKDIRLQCLDEILIYGSFPECALYHNAEEKIEFLANYRNTYIEKDVLQIPLIDDWKPYNQLLEFLATYNACTFHIKDLIKHIGISDKTIKKYLAILEKTMLLHVLPIYTKSVKRRLAKSPKIYFSDMGLVSYLTESYDLHTLRSTGDIGNRLESFVISEFIKATENDLRPNPLSFWRTSNGYEVDLIYSYQNKLIPIEIKYGQPKLKSLRVFSEEQNNIQYNCVLYRGNYKYDKQTNTHFVPIWGI